jgi:hypothetical protein
MAGAALGALVSFLVTLRLLRGIEGPWWQATTVWVVLSAGPLLGFLLAAILGDRLLDLVEDLLK